MTAVQERDASGGGATAATQRGGRRPGVVARRINAGLGRRAGRIDPMAAQCRRAVRMMPGSGAPAPLFRWAGSASCSAPPTWQGNWSSPTASESPPRGRPGGERRDGEPPGRRPPEP